MHRAGVEVSAAEAMAANTQRVIDTWRARGDLDVCPDPRIPFEELHSGDVIRHAGEWWLIAIWRSNGTMCLVTDDGRRETVKACAGEAFLRFEEGF